MVVRPGRELVKIGKTGTFEDRLKETMQNLANAINRRTNAGEFAIWAKVRSGDLQVAVGSLIKYLTSTQSS